MELFRSSFSCLSRRISYCSGPNATIQSNLFLLQSPRRDRQINVPRCPPTSQGNSNEHLISKGKQELGDWIPSLSRNFLGCARLPSTVRSQAGPRSAWLDGRGLEGRR